MNIKINREPENNVIVVGYPKSGNTWCSRLLGDALNSPVTGIKDAKPLCEEGLDRPGKYVVRQLHLKPVAIKAGGCEGDDPIPNAYTFCEQNWGGEKIIHIVRNPLDVCVSVKHYWDLSTVDDAFYAMANGTHPLVGVGAWADFVNRWHEAHVPTHLVRYEDMLEDALHELLKMLFFLDPDGTVDSHHLSEVIERQSFDERVEHIKTSGQKYNYGQTVQLKNMRKGEAGDWRRHFTQDLTLKATTHWSLQMIRYAYIEK